MQPVLIGLDAGTSFIKAVAFDDEGRQLGCAAVRNTLSAAETGRAQQDMPATWRGAVQAIRDLLGEHPELTAAVVAIAVTGQGDGTWLVDAQGRPLEAATTWLDGRAGDITCALDQSEAGSRLRNLTGSGINPSLQSCQLMWFHQHQPALLQRADKALHCKGWLFYCLTGELQTDAAEACHTFGNHRTAAYDTEVLALLGLQQYRHLLPAIAEPFNCHAQLTADAARATGLAQGTPVTLAPVDMVSATLGAGVYQREADVGASVLGSAGVHARVVPENEPIAQRWQGYTMPFPVPGTRLQVMTHMAATLNIDWLADLVYDLVGRLQPWPADAIDRYTMLDAMAAESAPAQVVYAPFIHANGERAPMLEPAARAQFIGLHTGVRFPQLVRAVYEGLALATCDCFDAMGARPKELRAGGGALRSQTFRTILASSMGVPLRSVGREEVGAAGAAMMAAVALGHYPDLDAACPRWTAPYLGERQAPDARLTRIYADILPVYRNAYRHMHDNWLELNRIQRLNAWIDKERQ